MCVTIKIPNRLFKALVRAGFEDNKEAGAWLLFKEVIIENDPWTSTSRKILILNEIIRFTHNDTIDSSQTHLSFNTDSYVALLKRAAEKNYVVGFLHGHPTGHRDFSNWDDENERQLLQAAKNRNGDSSELVSILTLPNNFLKARLWADKKAPDEVELIVTGRIFTRFDLSKADNQNLEKYDRQARVFGEEFNQKLSCLSVSVIGAGGTGSPLAIMLAKAGVGKIALVDDDKIEESNLHRLWGSGDNDVGEYKAEVLANFLSKIQSKSNISFHIHKVQDKNIRDVLKASDIIFCATDDHAGRMMLNRFAYFYETPVIDIGLATQVGNGEKIQDMTGRVTTICPGEPCLLCRGVIDPVRAREENIKYRSLEEYVKLRDNGYILEGGDPEPAFIAMTTSTATMAVEELSQMLSQFRGQEKLSSHRLRRFHIIKDRTCGGNPHENCPICANNNYWGLGDVSPFLDRIN